VSVFSPDDLALVKDGPGERRRFCDDTLVALALKYDALRLELDRVVKQRNTLLKQAAGRLDDATGDDARRVGQRFAELGDQFGHARAVLIAKLDPDGDRGVRAAGRQAHGGRAALRAALAAAQPASALDRVAPRRRAPRRVDGRPASRRRRAVRSTACRRARMRRRGSSARSRSRCGSPRTGWWPRSTGSAPVLVLDDVLSELDGERSAALLHHLPPGQVVLTTAGVLPEAAHPDAIVRIEAGAVLAE
jgi:DNA replication and repair protein RecF